MALERAMDHGPLAPGEVLVCHACGSVTQDYEVERCLDCGSDGFIRTRPGERGTRSMAARFPESLAKDWTPIPRALHEHGEVLGLTGIERAVVVALAHHQYEPDQVVYPGVERLALLTGFGAATVRRALHRLAGEDPAKIKSNLPRLPQALVARARGRTKRGTFEVTTYDLAPLWRALAEVADQRSERTLDQGSERAVDPAPVSSESTECRSPAIRVRGTSDQSESDPAITLVAEREVTKNEKKKERDSVPYGTAPPQAAATVSLLLDRHPCGDCGSGRLPSHQPLCAACDQVRRYEAEEEEEA